MARRLGIVIYPGFEILDATGPISAFAYADRYAGDAYEVRIIAPEAGVVASSAGAGVAAEALDASVYDTIVVAGGRLEPATFVALVPWLRRQQSSAKRLASVCSGAYLLAEAGLLDGKRATTHWNNSGDFSRRYPAIRLEPDRIYVRDGVVWTSAGITAGIDLALALIEDDLGVGAARHTAQQLVVHHRRPGGQSQFSGLLDLGGVNGRFCALLEWVRLHLSEPLNVERLADQAAMSPRHFTRAFTSEVGFSPARAVERLRVEAARARVEGSHEQIERIAETTGFGDAERMRRAFLRTLGQPPQALRRHARA